MCERSDLISGGTTHGCSTMALRQPMMPSLLARPCTLQLYLISKTKNESQAAKISDSGGNSSRVAGHPEHTARK
jgi:hypothetical protein